MDAGLDPLPHEALDALVWGLAVGAGGGLAHVRAARLVLCGELPMRRIATLTGLPASTVFRLAVRVRGAVGEWLMSGMAPADLSQQVLASCGSAQGEPAAA